MKCMVLHCFGCFCILNMPKLHMALWFFLEATFSKPKLKFCFSGWLGNSILRGTVPVMVPCNWS